MVGWRACHHQGCRVLVGISGSSTLSWWRSPPAPIALATRLLATNAEIIDDYSIKITFTEPNARFLTQLGMGSLWGSYTLA